jgi:hypothetical protein
MLLASFLVPRAAVAVAAGARSRVEVDVVSGHHHM